MQQPTSQSSIGDPSQKSHRSQYTEHHYTEQVAYSENTYPEIEANDPEDLSLPTGRRTNRQELDSSDERDLEEDDQELDEEDDDDDVNSEIESGHLESNGQKRSLPDVEEEEEEELEDQTPQGEKPSEAQYQSFGNPDNKPPVTTPAEENTQENKDKHQHDRSKYTRPSHSGSPNRSRVHNYSIGGGQSLTASQMNYTQNFWRDFSPSKVTVEEFEEYYEIFCINFLKRREEELERKRRAQAEQELSELQDRPHINSNPNKKHIPLLARTPLLNARREKEMERMRQEKEAKMTKELEELTFKPNINQRSRDLTSPTKNFSSSNSTNQLHKRSPNSAKARKPGPFKPKINHTSRAIAKEIKERISDDVVDRLYYQSNVSQSKKDELTKQLTPRFTPYLNKNTEKILKKKNRDNSFQGQRYEDSDDEQEEYTTEDHNTNRRFETEPNYQTPRKTHTHNSGSGRPQDYNMEEANNQELLAILKQFNGMLKKKNENPINLNQLGSLMAGYADKRKAEKEQAARKVSNMEKNLKQVHGSLKNLREKDSDPTSSLKEVRFDDEDYSTDKKKKKSPKKSKKFQTEKTETQETNSEAPLSARNASLYSSKALLKNASSNDLASSANNLEMTEKSAKKKKKDDSESPKKKKKKNKDNVDSNSNINEENGSESLEKKKTKKKKNKDQTESQLDDEENNSESPEKKKKKKNKGERGMNTDEIALLEKGTQTSKKSKKTQQSNSDISSQIVGSKNAIEGWYNSNQEQRDDDIIFVSNEGHHHIDEDRGQRFASTSQAQEASFGSQSKDYQDVNVNNFRSNHSQRVKYDSEKSKGSSSNVARRGDDSRKGQQNDSLPSRQGLSDNEKSYQSENTGTANQKSRYLDEKLRSQNQLTNSEESDRAEEYEEYEEFEQEEKPKRSHNKHESRETLSNAGQREERSVSNKAGSRDNLSNKRDERSQEKISHQQGTRGTMSNASKRDDKSKDFEQQEKQYGRNRAQTNEVKSQNQGTATAQESTRKRGYSDPKAEKSPTRRAPSNNHKSQKPSAFRESSNERNPASNSKNANPVDKFKSISSISENAISDQLNEEEKILSFNDEKGFSKSIDSSSNSHDDDDSDVNSHQQNQDQDQEEKNGEIRNRVESISFSAGNKAFNYRSNQSDQQAPQSSRNQNQHDSIKSKASLSSQDRLHPEERRQPRSHRPVQYEVMSTETIQIEPTGFKKSSMLYAMDRNDRTLNSASSRGLKAIAQKIVKKFKAYDEQIKNAPREYTISVSPPRSGSRGQSQSYSPERQTLDVQRVQEPHVAEKKYFKSAHKAQIDSVEGKSSKKHRMSLQGQGESSSGKTEKIKRYTVGSR